MREITVWGDKMNTVVYMGNPESREKLREIEFYFNSNPNNKKKKILKFNVLITSYDTAINDIAVLKKTKWECMVVDEAHRLKNNDSKFFKTSNQIETRFKVLLTGTPL